MRAVGIGALALLGLVGAVVGERLLRLSRRTRQLPEQAIGLGLVLITVIGAPMSAAGRLPALVSTPLGDGLFGLGLASALGGIALLFVFTWRVFRPDAEWAKGVVGLAALAACIDWLGLVLASQRGQTLDEILPHTRPWSLAIVGLVALAFVWSSAESLRYHARLRRRLALGLADPVVVNRFLLWGISGVATVVMLGMIVACILAGQAPLRDPLPMTAIAAAGNVASASWYLAFLPPPGYLRWVRRRATILPG